MPKLDYHGPGPASANDVATFDYAAALLGTGLTTIAVNDRINANLADKVLKSYVDAADALNASQAFVDAGDATRLKLTAKGAANGVVPLGPGKRASSAYFSVPHTQRWASGLWTPSAYNGALTGITAEAGLYTLAVSDPGYAYKVVVYGLADANTSVDGEHPIVQVRQGSTTGTIIASGRGAADNYLYTTGMNGGDDFERVDPDYIGTSLWQTQYSAGNVSRGYDHIPSGHEVEWDDAGAETAHALHRRVAASDRYTNGNDQLITLTQGIVPSQTQSFGEVSMTILIARMSDDFQNMVWMSICSDDGGHRLRWYVRRNGSFDQVGPTAAISQSPGTKWSLGAQGTTYRPFKNNVLVASGVWSDTGNASLIGSTTRGWGFGHRAGYRGFPANAQTTPASVAEVRISDYPTLLASAGINVTPVNFATQSVLTGPTTLYARASRSGSAAQIGVTAFNPRMVAFTVPA